MADRFVVGRARPGAGRRPCAAILQITSPPYRGPSGRLSMLASTPSPLGWAMGSTGRWPVWGCVFVGGDPNRLVRANGPRCLGLARRARTWARTRSAACRAAIRVSSQAKTPKLPALARARVRWWAMPPGHGQDAHATLLAQPFQFVALATNCQCLMDPRSPHSPSSSPIVLSVSPPCLRDSVAEALRSLRPQWAASTWNNVNCAVRPGCGDAPWAVMPARGSSSST